MQTSPIAWFNSMHWNEIGKYEPVGTEVLVLTESMKIIRAKRLEPTKNKLEPNTYYSVDTLEPLFGHKKPVKWAYP